MSHLNEDINILNNEYRNTSNNNNSSNNNNELYQKVSRFNNRYVDVLKDMSKQKFRDEVIGPIGLFINIKDGYSQNQLAVERILSRGVLSSFIVSNSDDRYLLNNIFKARNVQATIYIQHKESRYNVPPTVAGVTTIMDSLVIEKDIVYNCMIDQMKINRIPIIENEIAMERQLCEIQQGVKVFKYKFISRVVTSHGHVLTVKFGKLFDYVLLLYNLLHYSIYMSFSSLYYRILFYILFFNLFTYLTYLPTYLPIYLPIYLCIYLPTYLPTYIYIYLPTYVCINALYLSFYLSITNTSNSSLLINYS